MIGSLLMGGLVTGVAGVLLSLPALRLKGFYLAMSTLVLQELLSVFYVDQVPLTGGDEGIYGIPPITVMGYQFKGLSLNYLLLLLAILIVVICYAVAKSKFGQNLVAIREDADLAESLGINVTRHKVIVFFFSSFIIGFGGALLGPITYWVGPSMFDASQSFAILTMINIGGRGTIPGPIIGAMLLTAFPYAFREIYLWRQAFYGVLLVVSSIFFTAGLYPHLKRALNYLKSLLSKKEV
jgi:branched-chain amino acid transport system permease protein